GCGVVDGRGVLSFSPPPYLRRVTPAGAVTTVANVGSPQQIVVEPTGNILVADSASHVIRRVTPAGVLSVVAGTPGVSGSANGPVATALFKNPRGVALDQQGNIYISDGGNFLIRKLDTNGVVSTLAGRVGVSGTTNGIGTNAGFYTLVHL